MKRRFLLVLLASMLAGCAGKIISEQMRGYVGQPIAAIIAKLGYPTSEQMIAGAKVYIWATGYMVRGTNFDCKIRAIVDAREIITTWDFEGSERGCQQYAASLR